MAEFTAPRETEYIVAMKPESTAGIDVFGGTYLAADVLPVIVGSVRFSQDQNEIENTMTAGHMGRAASILGAATARVDFSMYWRGRGSAYDDLPTRIATEMDLPLRGCGLATTFTDPGGAGAAITHQPTATDEVMTIYCVQKIPGGNALSFQLVGCLGTFSCGATAAGRMRFDFSYFGSLEERADITYVGGTLAQTPSHPTLKGALFQIGGTDYAPRIANVGFGMNALVSHLPSINATNGIAGTKIFDRAPSLTIDPEADREANSAWWAALRDSGPLKDVTFQLGTAQFNRLKFKIGAAGAATAQVVQQGVSSRGGITTLPTVIRATISAGSDDFQLVAD